MSLARGAKIVRWHLISPRILASAANEINYHGPLSLSREPQRPTSPEVGAGKKKQEGKKDTSRTRNTVAVRGEPGDALI